MLQTYSWSNKKKNEIKQFGKQILICNKLILIIDYQNTQIIIDVICYTNSRGNNLSNKCVLCHSMSNYIFQFWYLPYFKNDNFTVPICMLLSKLNSIIWNWNSYAVHLWNEKKKKKNVNMYIEQKINKKPKYLTQFVHI